MIKPIEVRAADNIRLLAMSMVERAKSGHPGGPMGGADFMHILFSEFMRFDPNDPNWWMRDRFFLDPGHLSSMLYASLSLCDKYSMEDLKNFRQWDSPTPGHPELCVERGIENTSGPLGLGHAFGIGAAISERFLAARFGENTSHRTFIYISDGGIQEEISQGGGRIAGLLGLGNITMFYDANDVQLSTTVDAVTNEDTAKKYEAWNWHVQTIDGNNAADIRKALANAIGEKGRPSLIIGKTAIGKGLVKEDGSSYEGEVETHGKPISKTKASYEGTLKNLGGNIEEPFEIFEDVANLYRENLIIKTRQANERQKLHQDWKNKNPEKAAQLQGFLSNNAPDINWSDIQQIPNKSTREASGAVLAHFADHVPNMIVASADLSNSDRTDFFLNKTKAFTRHDFSGAFLQAGVSELTMAALAVGMQLHGGVVAVCATFFVFSDYMKPAMRVAALMETPVKFIWTHDAFRVGEDGPTHQPVEHEMQLRLLEKLQNHSHRNSFLVLRPADVQETTIAWKMALENLQTPSGLIFSRQGVKDIPALPNSTRFSDAKGAEKGGYIVQDCKNTPDVILIANGSEVSSLIAGAELLQQKTDLNIRIVSVPSEGVFRTQSHDYQSSILPDAIPKFGLTAGLSITLESLVGAKGKVFGLNHFGYSAPYSVLDEKFGFTAENICKEVIDFLGK